MHAENTFCIQRKFAITVLVWARLRKPYKPLAWNADAPLWSRSFPWARFNGSAFSFFPSMCEASWQKSPFCRTYNNDPSCAPGYRRPERFRRLRRRFRWAARRGYNADRPAALLRLQRTHPGQVLHVGGQTRLARILHKMQYVRPDPCRLLLYEGLQALLPTRLQTVRKTGLREV